MNDVFRVTRQLSVNPYQIIAVLTDKLRWNLQRAEELRGNGKAKDLAEQIGRIEMLEEILDEFEQAIGE